MDEMKAMWGRITCPTLLIYGEQSDFGDPSEGGRFDAFKNAELAGISDAGHWVHHDQLDVFLKLLKDFLE
jgi:pimeloyl-ACP methyl ester carboxylesterase